MPTNHSHTLPLPARDAICVSGLVAARGERLVLQDVSFSVATGETVALLGANGAGKTTLFRCLAGLLRPRAGEILLAGQTPFRNLAARRCLGVVSHEPLVYATLTPRENLRLAATLCDLSKPDERLAQLLAQAGLNSHADRPTGELSCGLRQRLSIIRALVHEPTIVLLDEPSSGLDDEGRDWLVQQLGQLHTAGTTVCFTTHDRALADAVADRQLRIVQGRIQSEQDSPSRSYPQVFSA